MLKTNKTGCIVVCG